MNIAAEYGPFIVGIGGAVFAWGLDWRSWRQFERKHGKIDRSK